MDEKILLQLEQWFKEEEHLKIVETISSFSIEALDYNLIGQLGRAYNNIYKYDKAIETLMAIAEEGQVDALWHYRMGYSYYHKNDLEKALSFFEKSLALGDEEALYFCEKCRE